MKLSRLAMGALTAVFGLILLMPATAAASSAAQGTTTAGQVSQKASCAVASNDGMTAFAHCGGSTAKYAVKAKCNNNLILYGSTVNAPKESTVTCPWGIQTDSYGNYKVDMIVV